MSTLKLYQTSPTFEWEYTFKDENILLWFRTFLAEQLAFTIPEMPTDYLKITEPFKRDQNFYTLFESALKTNTKLKQFPCISNIEVSFNKEKKVISFHLLLNEGIRNVTAGIIASSIYVMNYDLFHSALLKANLESKNQNK